MKLRLLMTIFILSALNVIQGQKMEEHTFKHTYLRLPATPLTGDFKTYDLVVDPGSFDWENLGCRVNDHVQFNQFSHEPGRGDFIVLISLNGDHFIRKELKTEELSAGKGADKRTRTSFHYLVSYRVPISYQILDAQRNVIASSIYKSYDAEFTFKFSKGFPTKIQLAREWDMKNESVLKNAVKKKLVELLKGLGRHLRNQYDRVTVTENLTFYGIKKADKIDQEAMATGVVDLQSVIQAATVDAPLTIDSFGENIGLWESALETLDPDKRKEAIGYQAAACNLALAHALTGSYEKAYEYHTRISDVSKRKHLSGRIHPFIMDRHARTRRSRELTFTFSNEYNEANDQAIRQAVKEKQTTEVAALQHKLTTDAQERAKRRPARGNTNIYLKNGEYFRGMWEVEYSKPSGRSTPIRVEQVAAFDSKKGEFRMLQINEISHYGTSDYRFDLIQIKDGSLQYYVFQEAIKSTEGLTLGRVVSRGKEVYAFLKGPRPSPGSLHEANIIDPRIGKKGVNSQLAKDFSDCETITTKATSKDNYPANKDGLKQVVDDFENCSSAKTAVPSSKN